MKHENNIPRTITENDFPAAKRPCLSHASALADPTSFVTWNCNGLISRCKWNRTDLVRLVKETEFPDVITIQEARLKARSSSQRDQPHPEDYQEVAQQLQDKEIFGEYDTKIWSLADTRYSGTLTLLHKRLNAQKIVKDNAAFSFQGAIDLMLTRFNLKRSLVGIPESSATTGASKCKGSQSSLKSFFSTTKKVSPANQHHEHGRFQFLQFPNLDLIHTYVPNNGNKDNSFERRKAWDEQMKEFLLNRRRIMEVAGENRALLWCGDLNVTRDYRDGTHWAQKNKNTDTNQEKAEIYEWWTDESKCFVSQPKRDSTLKPENHGMPSFTPGERSRFHEIIKESNLTDVWRELHPNGKTMTGTAFDEKSSSENVTKFSEWDLPNWTWRGHLGVNGSIAKYQGKAQRIDYFLTSMMDMERVEKCEILGYGDKREGLFCGSDHCASILKLRGLK